MQIQNQFAQSVVKGQPDLKFNTNTISCEVDSSEAASLIPGQAVKLVDSSGGVPKVIKIAADTDKIFGVISYNVKDSSFVAGDPLEISADGNVLYLEASAAIARGAKVMAVVSGSKVATSTAGKVVLGFAFDKALADGDLIRVYMENFSEESQSGTAANVAEMTGTAGMTGTVNGTIEDVADIALSTSDTYTDAAVNSAVNAAVLGTNLELKELSTKQNAVIAALVAAGLMSA